MHVGCAYIYISFERLAHSTHSIHSSSVPKESSIISRVWHVLSKLVPQSCSTYTVNGFSMA